MQAVERHVAEMPLVDPHGHRRPAMAVGRQSIELAGTADLAVADAEFWTLDPPIDVGHRATPDQSVSITPYGP